MINRRQILKRSALFGLPLILPSGLLGDEANRKLNVGFIGIGKRSGPLFQDFLRDPRVKVVAVCDVDSNRCQHGKRVVDQFYKNEDCKAHSDFRKITTDPGIDAVVIITPDHWHTLQILSALEHQKDVYAEKPLTHNIRESVILIDAVNKSGRVVQTGSQQRSAREFRVACELVRNGVIGKVQRGTVSFGGPGKPCDLPGEEMEPGLDWEMWLGPAPSRPYNSILSPRGVHTHFPNWRDYREYGGGMVTDWGAHHLDIVQWALGKDEAGPTAAKKPSQEGAEYGATLLYDDIAITHTEGNGVHLIGADGEIKVNRGKFELKLGKEIIATTDAEGARLGEQLDRAEEAYLKEVKIPLYRSPGHVKDFLDCIESRKKPITHAEIGCRSINAAHLMNLAYYHHADLAWEPVSNTFASGSSHPAEWLGRTYREGWKI